MKNLLISSLQMEVMLKFKNKSVIFGNMIRQYLFNYLVLRIFSIEHSILSALNNVSLSFSLMPSILETDYLSKE